MVALSAVRLYRDGVTLTFDLSTQKCNQVICVPRCTSDKSLAKIRQQILEISRKHKTTSHVNHGRTHARTDDPKTYSIRRRQRLNNADFRYWGTFFSGKY